MEAKEKVGIKATEFIKDDMVIGLGTGSTTYYFVKEIGRLIRAGSLTIKGGVVTSEATRQLAEAEGIPLLSIKDVDYIDVTVDGTDEFDPCLNGIKGGGGALLIEKIVASNSHKVIWIADTSKQVAQLGAFPLPVEVIKTGSKQLGQQFEALNYQPELRMAGSEPYLTDEGNYIIDLHLQKIDDPIALAETLIQMVGVVEHGLFLNVATTVIVSEGDEVVILEK